MGNAFFTSQDENVNYIGTKAFDNFRPTSVVTAPDGQVVQPGDPSSCTPNSLGLEFQTKNWNQANAGASKLDIEVKLQRPAAAIYLVGRKTNGVWGIGLQYYMLHFFPLGLNGDVAGFTPSGGEPWIPFAGDLGQIGQGIKFCKPVDHFFISVVNVPAAGPQVLTLLATSDLNEFNILA